MKYIVTIHFYDINEEHSTSYMFKFDDQIEAIRFANNITDGFYGIERVDVNISWKVNAK